MACRPIELGLKAYLNLRGDPLADLARSPYGHDLNSLLNEANGKGLGTLVKLSTDQANEIRAAAQHYGEKLFEYPVGEALQSYPSNPDIEIILETADQLLTGLYEACLNA